MSKPLKNAKPKAIARIAVFLLARMARNPLELGDRGSARNRWSIVWGRQEVIDSPRYAMTV